MSSGQQAPCGTYTHLRWPAPHRAFDGFDSFEWELTPELDTSQGYFWAHQFALRDSGDPPSGGYVGLQANGSYPPGRPTKVAIFSIWNTLDARGSGIAQPFGGEGTGYQTLIRWDWVAGRRYQLRISTPGTDPQWGTLVGRDGPRHRDRRRGRDRSHPRPRDVEQARHRVSGVDRAVLPAHPPLRRHGVRLVAVGELHRRSRDASDRPRSTHSFGEPACCANSRIATLEGGVVRQQMGLPAPAGFPLSRS